MVPTDATLIVTVPSRPMFGPSFSKSLQLLRHLQLASPSIAVQFILTPGTSNYPVLRYRAPPTSRVSDLMCIDVIAYTSGILRSSKLGVYATR